MALRQWQHELEEAKAPVGVLVTLRPGDVWSGSLGSLPASQTGIVTEREAAQQWQMVRQTACGIPLAVKLTVREGLPAQLYRVMPTLQDGSDSGHSKCPSEPQFTLLKWNISQELLKQLYPGSLLFKYKLPLSFCYLGAHHGTCENKFPFSLDSPLQDIRFSFRNDNPRLN